MNTLTFKKPVRLSRTHFHDLEDLFIFVQTSGIQGAKNIPVGKEHPFLKGASKRYSTHEKNIGRYEYLARKHLS